MKYTKSINVLDQWHMGTIHLPFLGPGLVKQGWLIPKKCYKRECIPTQSKNMAWVLTRECVAKKVVFIKDLWYIQATSSTFMSTTVSSSTHLSITLLSNMFMHLIDPQLIPKHCFCARRNFKVALLVFNIIFYTKGQRAPSTCLYILILKDGEKEVRTGVCFSWSEKLPVAQSQCPRARLLPPKARARGLGSLSRRSFET